MFTLLFWKAAVERMIRAGAAGTLSLWLVGDGMMNAFDVDWADAAGIFLGSAAISLLMSLTGGAIGPGAGPSFTGQEDLSATHR